MKIKTLVLGNSPMMQSINNSLLAMGSEVVRLYEIPETITVLKQEHLNLAVVDGTIPDIVNVCFRLIWICRLRVVIAAEDIRSIFNELLPLGIDGYLREQNEQNEFSAKIMAIAQKGSQQFEKINVLVVEDDRDIQEAIEMFFQIFWPEAELTQCRDGLSGVNAAKKKSMDVVLLDLGLPDIDGFEVLSSIRGFSNVPIVILTARRDKEQIIRAMQSRANDYVLKPFRQIELMLRIKKAINIGRVQGITHPVKLHLG
jgi:CheY-like chemotaxis protein